MIKNNLRHILLDRNMSIRELAERVSITYSIVYDFATMRRRSMQWDVLDAICQELGVEVGEVLVLVPDGDK